MKAESAEAASAITSITPEEAQEMEEIIRNGMDVPQVSRQETVSVILSDVKDTSETTEDDDPEDAIYRSLDWETNPPINGFYETMMSLTPERRAELRRLGREKMDANAAKQMETKEVAQPQSVRPLYPIENGLKRKGKPKSSVWNGKCARKKPS